MQHIDLEERIIIWLAFDFFFPDLSGFGITFSAWKDGISRLRRISCRSAAPWCTEPPLGSLPRATAPCSMPVTSRRGNITPRTYQWLPTQVSQRSALWCLSQRNAAGEMFNFFSSSFLSLPFFQNHRIWRACVVVVPIPLFLISQL